MTATYIFLAAAVLMAFQTGFYSGVKALYGKGTAYTVSKMCGCVIFTALCVCGIFLGGVSAYGIVILLGMLLGSAGDYFLSLARKGRLKVGIGCFLGGHLFYIAAFMHGNISVNMLVIAAAASVVMFLILRAVCGAGFKAMETTAAAYISVITLMTVSALFVLIREPESLRSRFIAAGGVLFYVSDLLWAAASFAKGMGKKTAITLKILNVVTYFPAQLLIAASVMGESIKPV